MPGFEDIFRIEQRGAINPAAVLLRPASPISPSLRGPLCLRNAELDVAIAEAVAVLSSMTPLSLASVIQPVSRAIARAEFSVDLHWRDDLQRLYGLLVAQYAHTRLSVREKRELRDRVVNGKSAKVSTPINRGDEIDDMWTEAGGSDKARDDDRFWCAAFVYHCHLTAATMLGGETTCPRTTWAGGMWHGNSKLNTRWTKAQVLATREETIRPGDVFVFDGKSGGEITTGKFFSGHTGLVTHVTRSPQARNNDTVAIDTIEGNTNTGGSRDGDGVYLRTDRFANKRVYGFVRPRLRFPWCAKAEPIK